MIKFKHRKQNEEQMRASESELQIWGNIDTYMCGILYGKLETQQ